MQTGRSTNPTVPRTRDATPAPPVPVPEIDSRELLHARNELLIRHAGECYRLRLTRNDKLILTK